MRVLVCGPIGVTDLGDVALLAESVRRLKSFNADITLFALDPHEARRQHPDLRIAFSKEATARWRERRFAGPADKQDTSLLEAVSRADVLYFVGGGYFNKHWEWFLHNTFFGLIRAAKEYGVPIFVSAVTVGPFGEEDRKAARECFSYVDTLFLREPTREYNVLPEGDYTPVGDDLLGADRRLDVVANIHQPRVVETLAPLLQNRRVLFLPFSTWPTADLKYGNQLKALVPTCTVAEPVWSVAKECIREAKLVISTRLHPLILAKDSGTPGIGIINDRLPDLYTIKLGGTGFPCKRVQDLAKSDLTPPRDAIITRLGEVIARGEV